MPEIYSNGRHNKENSSTSPWCTIELDWPCEIVVAEAVVVTSREPNPFEWIAVRILQDFADGSPTLAEAAEELGIKDPVLLTETIQDLIESGVVEKRNPNGNIEFSNCRLTVAGQAFLTEKRINSLPERHGLQICLDAITGEYVAQPLENSREQPQNPVIPPDKLPERRINIGLDMARELAKAQDEPYLTAQSRIADVKVQYEQGSFIWVPLEASLGIDVSGILRCSLHDGTDEQQSWLEQLDFKHKVFDQLLLLSIGTGVQHLSAQPREYVEWQKRTKKLIAPSSIDQEAHRVIKAARQQIVSHGYWATRQEIRSELIEAANRGVRCILVGQRSLLAGAVDAFPEDIEIVEQGSSTNNGTELVLLADGSQGLSVDRVKLRTPRGRDLEVILASVLKKSHVLRFKQ